MPSRTSAAQGARWSGFPSSFGLDVRWVALGKSLNLSILQFPHGKWGIFLALSILQSDREDPRGQQL